MSFLKNEQNYSTDFNSTTFISDQKSSTKSESLFTSE